MRASILVSTCLLGLAFAAPRADAITVVVGGGLAEDCYASAEFGDPYKAFDVCTRALSQTGISIRDKAATYINRSVVRLRVKDFSGAINDCDQSIARYPALSEAYVNRGAALLNLDQAREALKELDKAIEMGLEKVQLAYYNRGLAKEKLNDLRGAYADYRKALELDPTLTIAADQLRRFQINGVGGAPRSS